MQGLLVHQSRGLGAVCQTHSDVVKEARPQRHTYVCSEERTVMSHAVKCKQRIELVRPSAL